ncbi:MAG: hypothetical protein ACR2JN_09140 [Lapillicoccus sp.]
MHRIPGSVEEEARAVALVLPAPLAYSHQTAARLLRLPVPVPWHPGESLSVMRPSTSTRLRRRGVRGQRGLESRDVTSVRGLPVTGFVSAWCDLAGQLGLDDLVILGDAVLARRRVGLDAFTSAVEERRHGRWVTRIRRALSLLRVGSGSPMETRTRLVFARGGLPEPELNGDVFDDFGEWVARGDFVWRQARVVGKYEGAHHRTRAATVAARHRPDPDPRGPRVAGRADHCRRRPRPAAGGGARRPAGEVGGPLTTGHPWFSPGSPRRHC